MEPAPTARLLVIEDNAELLRLLGELLADRFRVIPAISGEKALDLARVDPPDLALIDVDLPGMDGLAAARALKELRAEVPLPVLILTAHASAEEEARIRGTGCCDDFLAKPAPLVEIRDRLERLLEQGPFNGGGADAAHSGARA